MGSTVPPGAIITPNTKAGIPPAYTGLQDAAVFGRLSSRPDRINNEAIAFFNAWRANTGDIILLTDKDGNVLPSSRQFRIGSARQRALRPANAAARPAAAATAASTFATGTAVSTAKKP